MGDLSVFSLSPKTMVPFAKTPGFLGRDSMLSGEILQGKDDNTLLLERDNYKATSSCVTRSLKKMSTASSVGHYADLGLILLNLVSNLLRT